MRQDQLTSLHFSHSVFWVLGTSPVQGVQLGTHCRIAVQCSAGLYPSHTAHGLQFSFFAYFPWRWEMRSISNHFRKEVGQDYWLTDITHKNWPSIIRFNQSNQQTISITNLWTFNTGIIDPSATATQPLSHSKHLSSPDCPVVALYFPSGQLTQLVLLFSYVPCNVQIGNAYNFQW